MTLRASVLLSLWIPCGCRSAGPPEHPAPPEIQVLLPASSFAALVRILEAVDANRPSGGVVEVRAVECDSLVDRSARAEFVRIYLHATVFAPDVGEARQGFAELRAALEAEARSPRRLEGVSHDRVERVFEQLDWSPPGSEDLVSFSDAIRLEVTPGRDPVREAGEPAAAPDPATVPAERYVHDLAADGGLAVHTVQARVHETTPTVRDLRCLLQPVDEGGGLTLGAIGDFLRALEAAGPASRLTHIEIERDTRLPDPLRDDSWTFEAELTVRVAAR